jgi:hypothetical protein
MVHHRTGARCLLFVVCLRVLPFAIATLPSTRNLALINLCSEARGYPVVTAVYRQRDHAAAAVLSDPRRSHNISTLGALVGEKRSQARHLVGARRPRRSALRHRRPRQRGAARPRSGAQERRCRRRAPPRRRAAPRRALAGLRRHGVRGPSRRHERAARRAGQLHLRQAMPQGAVAIYTELLGEEHRATTAVQAALGYDCYRLGRLDVARRVSVTRSARTAARSSCTQRAPVAGRAATSLAIDCASARFILSIRSAVARSARSTANRDSKGVWATCSCSTARAPPSAPTCAAFFLLPSKSSGEVGVLTSVVVSTLARRRGINKHRCTAHHARRRNTTLHATRWASDAAARKPTNNECNTFLNKTCHKRAALLLGAGVSARSVRPAPANTGPDTETVVKVCKQDAERPATSVPL